VFQAAVLAALFLASVSHATSCTQRSDAFGEFLAAGEDLDGDRIPDLVVSAHAEGDSQRSKVIALSGKNGRALWHAGMNWDAEVRAVQFMSDQDGDQVAEIAVVIQGSRADWMLVVYSGKSGRLIATHRQTLWTETILVPLCDVDGDSRPDLVSAFGGSVVRIRSWMDPIHERTLFLPAEFGMQGPIESAALLPDLDGDGLRDLACGIPHARKLSLVVAVSGKDGHVLVRADGKALGLTAPEFLGGRVASIGDFDGDGAGDILATNDGFELASSGGGLYARVISGKSGKTLFTHESEHGRGLFAACSDLDGDGCADLLVGDAGTGRFAPSISVVSGKTGAIRPLLPPEELEGRTVNWIDASCDFDGDNVREVLVVLRGEAQGLGSVRAYSAKDSLMLLEFIQPIE